MNDTVANKAHWSFWLISSLMLVWNVLGSINFFIQMDPDMVASYRESEKAIIQGRPLWATAGFALGVFGGALGCVLLLLKKNAAFYVFIVSLIGVVIATVHSLTLDIIFSRGEIIGIVILPILVAVFLIWYSRYVEGKGWLSGE